MDITRFLEERRAWVDGHLNSWLANRSDPVVSELQEAISCALQGGKRVRAALVMEAAELAGKGPDHVLPTAAAVECFHAYSLVHDDLPAMDNDQERRGQPTIHVRYGEATAILVGDSLVPLGFELISGEQLRYSEPKRVLRVLALLAQTLGWRGLTGGQYLDLSGGIERELWPEVHRRKTAALFEASLAAGAILGGMGEERLNVLREYGMKLGIAYQLIDDVRDWGEEDGAGHLSRFMNLQEAEQRVQESIAAALAALEPLGEPAERLRALTRYLAKRQT